MNVVITLNTETIEDREQLYRLARGLMGIDAPTPVNLDSLLPGQPEIPTPVNPYSPSAPIPTPGAVSDDDDDDTEASTADAPFSGAASGSMSNGDGPDEAGVQSSGDFDHFGVKHDPAIHNSNKKIYTEGKNAGRFHKRRNSPDGPYDMAYAGRTNLVAGAGAQAAPTAPPAPAPAAPVAPPPPPQATMPAPAPAPAPGIMDFNSFVQYLGGLTNRKTNPFPINKVTEILQKYGYSGPVAVAGPSKSDPNIIPTLVSEFQLADAMLFPGA